ncbi:MAG: hypothetical protein ACLRS8_08660 [Parabacteroides merdae]
MPPISPSKRTDSPTAILRNTSVQYKRNILDRDHFKDGGFTASYHFTVNDAFDYSGIKLVSERPELFTVKINGNLVNALPGEWWLDRSFGVYPIGGQVKKVAIR